MVPLEKRVLWYQLKIGKAFWMCRASSVVVLLVPWPCPVLMSLPSWWGGGSSTHALPQLTSLSSTSVLTMVKDTLPISKQSIHRIPAAAARFTLERQCKPGHWTEGTTQGMWEGDDGEVGCGGLCMGETTVYAEPSEKQPLRYYLMYYNV